MKLMASVTQLILQQLAANRNDGSIAGAGAADAQPHSSVERIGRSSSAGAVTATGGGETEPAKVQEDEGTGGGGERRQEMEVDAEAARKRAIEETQTIVAVEDEGGLEVKDSRSSGMVTKNRRKELKNK